MREKTSSAWKCAVCGYVHIGVDPPDVCPACGAPAEVFESHEEDPPPPPPASRGGGWKCMVCGYIHEGDAPPDTCPVCGATSDCFEAVADAEVLSESAEGVRRVVVVGAGAAGLAAVESLRATAPNAEITLVSRESHLPYFRLNLTRYLAGEVTAEQMPMHPEAWYADHGVQVLSDLEATRIDLDGHLVALSDGASLPYDKIVLTAGAHPFMPPFPGGQRQGVTSFRTIDDADRLIDAAQAQGRFVCIGGGILGLETAGALARRGASVTLVESFPWLMPRQLNREAAELINERLTEIGIELVTNARVTELVGDERVRGVALEEGPVLDADHVVVTAGIRTNSYLARLTGLDVNRGVVVDNHLVSSHPDVLAAGDVAEHRGVVYGIWPASLFQGAVAGRNAAGASREFLGMPPSNTLKVLGLDVVSVGQVEGHDGSYQSIELGLDGRYLRFLFHDSCLAGAILVGDASLTAAAKGAVEKRTDFSAVLRKSPTATDIAEALQEFEG